MKTREPVMIVSMGVYGIQAILKPIQETADNACLLFYRPVPTYRKQDDNIV